MSVLINLNTSVNPLSGGADTVTGTGEEWKITGSGTFVKGDTITIQLTDSQTGVLTQLGAGNITALVETFCFTYNNKIYMLAGDTTYFSAIGEPTIFNDPTAAGNGFITMADWFSSPEALTAIAPFQGKLLFTSRRTTQIWNVDPDPANYSQSQVLTNIGTIAPLSVVAIGDQDVYLAADNGFRSIQVRVATNNASVADVGVPVDLLVQPLLASLTDAQKATMCGIAEPSSNRYWCYIPNADGSVGYIWVFSRFGEEIAAWSNYTPSVETDLGHPLTRDTYTYTGLTIGATYYWFKGHSVSINYGSGFLTASGTFVATQTTAIVTTSALAPLPDLDSNLTERKSFIPVKFVTYQGQVWCLDNVGNVYQFGGVTNLVYSNCGVTAKTPYFDGGQPRLKKTYQALDAAFQGSWAIDFSPDYNLQAYKPVYNNTLSSFEYRRIPIASGATTHYSLEFTESGSGYARFSSCFMDVDSASKK